MTAIQVQFDGGPLSGKTMAIPVQLDRFDVIKLPDGNVVTPMDMACGKIDRAPAQAVNWGHYTRKVWRADGHGSSVMQWQGWERG